MFVDVSQVEIENWLLVPKIKGEAEKSFVLESDDSF